MQRTEKPKDGNSCCKLTRIIIQYNTILFY